LWLALPTFSTFSASNSFRAMALILNNEYLWGALLVFAGLRLRWYSERKDLKGRRDAMFGIFLIWMFITGMLIWSNIGGTGTVAYATVAYHALVIYINLAQQYKYTQEPTSELTIIPE
jgi:amino acid transporter